MTPPRTVKDIPTSRNIPQSGYLCSLNRLGNRQQVSLSKAPNSSRETQRSPLTVHDNLTAPTYRHFFKLKIVPKAVRLQVTQLKRIGIFASGRKQ